MTPQESEAIAACSQAIQDNPANIMAREKLVGLYLDIAQRSKTTNDIHSYISNLILAAQLVPDLVDEATTETIANYLTNLKDWEKVLIASSNLLARNKFNLRALELRINALLELGKFDAAREYASQAAVDMPESSLVRSIQSSIEFKSGNLALALDLLGQAVALPDCHDHLRITYAESSIHLKQIDRGAKVYFELLKEKRDDNGIFVIIFDFISAVGVIDEVYEVWKTLSASDPSFYAHIFDRLCHIAYLQGNPREATNAAIRSIRVRQQLAIQLGIDKLNAEFILGDQLSGFGGLVFLPYLIKLRLLGWDNSALILLKDRQTTANPELLELMAPYLSIVSDQKVIEELSQTVGKTLTRRVAYHEHNSSFVRSEAMMALVDEEWQKQRRPSLLRIPSETEAYGYEVLSKYGLKKDDWFVAFHMRQNKVNEDGSFSPRDGRSIESYFDTLRAITRAGGWVVRMGDSSMNSLPPFERVIDLAHSPDNTGLLNVFLWAKAKFFIGLNSGPAYVPHEFGTPSMFPNWIPLLIQPPYREDLFIPKLLWHREKMRYLTFNEMFTHSVACSENYYHLKNAGIEIHDSSAEDIEMLAQEMLTHTVGGAEYSEAEIQQQQIFQSLLRSHGCLGNGRIGKEFLKKYNHLLAK